MSTAAAVITRVNRALLSGVVEERNKLSVALTASDTTVVLTYELSGVRNGTVIEIDAEQMYVWETTPGSKTLTVERAWNGTTAVTHAAGAIVTTQPRFPRANILEAMNYEIDDLSSPMNGLFQMKTVDIEWNGSDRMVDLLGISNIIDLYDVRFRWLATDYPIIRNVRLLRNMPNDDFPSGNALAIDDPAAKSGTLRVVAKCGFNNVTAETDNLQNVAGVSTTMEDILVLGSQIRLMSSREVKRNFTESQGDTRRADEVGAGAISNSFVNLQRLRRDRIQAEAAKLNRQYPTFLRG